MKSLETKKHPKLWRPIKGDVSRVTFDVGSQRTVYKSFEKTVCGAKSRKDLFLQLTEKLDKFFCIHKASYSIFDPEKGFMRVPLVHQDGEPRSGIMININAGKSLMRSVLETGYIHVEDFPAQTMGNIVERKILLLDNTNSLAIIPLISGSERIGTLNFASPAPFAFSTFSSHLFDYLFEAAARQFASIKL